MVIPPSSLKHWAAFPQSPCSRGSRWKLADLVTGQARRNLLTNEFLPLQAASTALPGFSKVHGRISHLLLFPRAQLKAWSPWLLSSYCSSTSCGRRRELFSSSETEGFGARRGAKHPCSRWRLRMHPVSSHSWHEGQAGARAQGSLLHAVSTDCEHGAALSGEGKWPHQPRKVSLPPSAWSLQLKAAGSGESAPGLGAWGCAWPQPQPAPTQKTAGSKSQCAREGLDRQKFYSSSNFSPKFNWQEEDLIDICPQIESALERQQILQSNSPASPTVPPSYLNVVLATQLLMLRRDLIISKKLLFAAASRQCWVRSSGIRLQAALWLVVRRKSYENQSSHTWAGKRSCQAQSWKLSSVKKG